MLQAATNFGISHCQIVGHCQLGVTCEGVWLLFHVAFDPVEGGTRLAARVASIGAGRRLIGGGVDGRLVAVLLADG